MTTIELRDGYRIAPPGAAHPFASLYLDGSRVAILSTQTWLIRQRRDVAVPAWAMLELLKVGSANYLTPAVAPEATAVREQPRSPDEATANLAQEDPDA